MAAPKKKAAKPAPDRQDLSRDAATTSYSVKDPKELAPGAGQHIEQHLSERK